MSWRDVKINIGDVSFSADAWFSDAPEPEHLKPMRMSDGVVGGAVEIEVPISVDFQELLRAFGLEREPDERTLRDLDGGWLWS